MKVAVYHKSVPNTKSQQKIDILRFFAEGVQVTGDSVINSFDYATVNADVGVIQGWINTDIIRPHLALRNNVINDQKSGYVVAADSNLFLY